MANTKRPFSKIKPQVAAPPSPTSLEGLKQQLASTEQEFDVQKTLCIQLSGMIQLLKHQVASLETPPQAASAPAPQSAETSAS